MTHSHPNPNSFSGCSAVRLAHLLWEQGAAGSNPATPTTYNESPSCLNTGGLGIFRFWAFEMCSGVGWADMGEKCLHHVCTSSKSLDHNATIVATLNVILDTRRKNPTKTFPLRIRITHRRKSVYLSLNIEVKQKEWDESKQRVRANHPLHNKINAHISGTLIGLQEIILDKRKKSSRLHRLWCQSILQKES